MASKGRKITVALLYAGVLFLLIATQWAHLSIIEMAATTFMFEMSRSCIMAFVYDERSSWPYGVIPAGKEKSVLTRSIGVTLALGLFGAASISAIFLY